MTTTRLIAQEAKAAAGVMSTPQKGGAYHFFLNYLPHEQTVDPENPHIQFSLDPQSLRQLHDKKHMEMASGAAADGRARPARRGRRWGHAFEVKKPDPRLARPSFGRLARPALAAQMKQGRAAPARVQQLAQKRMQEFKRARDLTLRVQTKPTTSVAIKNVLAARPSYRARPKDYSLLRHVAAPIVQTAVHAASLVAPAPMKPAFTLASAMLKRQPVAPRAQNTMAPARPAAPQPGMGRPRRRLLGLSLAA